MTVLFAMNASSTVPLPCSLGWTCDGKSISPALVTAAPTQAPCGAAYAKCASDQYCFDNILCVSNGPQTSNQTVVSTLLIIWCFFLLGMTLGGITERWRERSRVRARQAEIAREEARRLQRQNTAAAAAAAVVGVVVIDALDSLDLEINML